MKYQLRWQEKSGAAATEAGLPDQIEAADEATAREAALRMVSETARQRFTVRAEAIRVHAGAEVDG